MDRLRKLHHFGEGTALGRFGLLKLCSVPELDELLAQRPVRGEAIRTDDGESGLEVLLGNSERRLHDKEPRTGIW